MLNVVRCYLVIGRSDTGMNGPIRVEYHLKIQTCSETCEYVQIQSSSHFSEVRFSTFKFNISSITYHCV